MTYSIVVRDADTGELGVAVQSHWFGVGALVPHARAGVGAVATQSVPDPAHGPRLLDLLERGAAPDEALDEVLRTDDAGAYRQTAVVAADGRVAVHTGRGCLPDAGHSIGDGWSVQANMVASAEVWPAMAEAFVAADGPLAERMLAALDAAEAAGGDVRGRQSAALLVAGSVDLRVEDHPEPLDELRRLLVLHRAYAEAAAGDEAMAEGRAEAMAEHYERAARLAPGKPEIEFWAGLATAFSGDAQSGAERVRRAIDASPGLRTLLERLTADVAPGAEAVRRVLG